MKVFEAKHELKWIILQLLLLSNHNWIACLLLKITSFETSKPNRHRATNLVHIFKLVKCYCLVNTWIMTVWSFQGTSNGLLCKVQRNTVTVIIHRFVALYYRIKCCIFSSSSHFFLILSFCDKNRKTIRKVNLLKLFSIYQIWETSIYVYYIELSTL